MDSKFPEQSKTIQTDFVLPADTNSLNNLFGGELLARMDKVASIAAIKHSEQIVVTASINNVSFGEPVPNGSILTIEAKVSRAFNSSMEVFIDVWKQNKTDRNPSLAKHLFAQPRFHLDGVAHEREQPVDVLHVRREHCTIPSLRLA